MSISLWNDEQERPLQHLRVIDLTVMIPGPFVTRMLAQYGADVLKIEALPKGDPTRELADSACFDLLNQGKKSVAINLKTERGVQLIKELAEEADVFVENFREGVMDGLGLGYADISEVNPDLLYFSMRGNSGKHSGHAAHDLNFIANSGCGEWFIESGHPNYTTNFGDIVGGTMVPAMKLLFHLANPNRRGMHLIAHMDESFRALYLPRAFETYRGEGLAPEIRERFGIHKQLDGTRPHSRFYRCRDGMWISLNAVQAKHWETFCEVVDRVAWKSRREDPTLVPEVEKLFLDAPATYWEALSTNRDICLYRVIPWGEHISFSQARPQLATDPLTWCGFAPNDALLRVPNFGQDTFATIHALGLPNKDVAEYFQSGVLFQPDLKT